MYFLKYFTIPSVVYNHVFQANSQPHLFLFAVRLLRSCRPALPLDTKLEADVADEETEGEMLSLLMDSSLKKSAGKTATKTSGN